MNFVLEKDSTNYELMGGKGAALSKIGKAIDNVPDWFVIIYTGFDIEKKEIKEEARQEIEEKLREFNDDSYFAIRSSAGNEDSSENSFAGQFDTFLYVQKNDVINKVLDVYMSAFSERIETYRKENNIDEIFIPSVIVQKMINSEKSGVAFGANPVNSNIKEIVVSSVYGLGSGLVDGIATADTYTIKNGIIEKNIAKKDYLHVFEEGKVVQKEVDENLKDKQILTDDEILKVKELVKKASDFFGRYQDIEWAFEKGKLYLLQSRPITTLTNNKDGKINVFDNSNIVESYGGITTPLTFSFIRMVYENVYIELCKIFNVKQEKIEMNSQMFKNMLALIDGRVYYNLYGWYGLLSMFPGLGNNKKFMEQMMGVKESLPDDLFPVPEATFKDKIGLVNTGFGLVKGFFKIRKMTEKFYGRLNDALEDKDIGNMDLYELHDYYYELEKKLLHKWDAPLVNDFLAMIFYGQLREQCKKLFNEEGDLVHNDLLCNEGGIISSEPAKRIKEMAKMIKDNDDIIELLECKDPLYIQKELPKYPEFNKKINEYLDKFADRCLEELKLETLTLRDNPINLYTSIAVFAKRIKENDVEDIDEKKNRENAERKVKEKLRFKPVDKAKFNFILKQARFTVKNRENLRFERTRLFGRVRELFLRIGYILTSMNVIEEKRDIFYLEVDEILYYIDGKSTTNNLKELIAIRKEQYLKYNNMTPDERFYSYGAVNIGNDFKRENKIIEKSNNQNIDSKLELKGIGASPGIVTGKVRIIRNPSNAKLEQGEILVAEFTDPGWIMLFPAASGILVERGSLLSHSAIVSRELGIPAVVGITGLLDSLSDGDLVELNGTTGKVKIINENIDSSNDKDNNNNNNNKYIDNSINNNESKLNTLKDILNKTIKDNSKDVLYVKENIKYEDLYKIINSLGTSLIELGLKNKKIGLLSENRYEWEATFLSIICGVGTVVPIDKSLPKNEIENIINKAKVEAIFCSDKYLKLLKEIEKDSEILNYIICFDGKKQENNYNDIKYYSDLINIGKEQIDNGDARYLDAEVKEEDVCVIDFTSGTTNKSKAVMLTHKNICTNLINTSSIFDMKKEDICLSALPLHHVLEGLFCFLNSIYKGARRVFCNELDEIIDYIEKYKISFMGAVPGIYKYLLEKSEILKNESSHINIFMCGGASLDSEVVTKYDNLGIKLIQGYGLTECSPVVSLENKKDSKIGSVGKIIPNLEVKIIDTNEKGIGEIAVRGDSITIGYLNDDEETNNTIIDGWLYTGDLGKIDEEGFLYICGRKKDLIVLQNGKKVFPGEIEEKINRLNEVKESIVFEKDDKIYSKIVYLRESFDGKTIDEIHDYLYNKIKEINTELPQFKQIKDITISDEELEKTSTGKIKRNQNLDYNINEIKKDNYNETLSKEEIIKNIIIEKTGKKDIPDDSNFAIDLGADSLDMVEIYIKIEKELNIKIEKDSRRNILTVKDLINVINKNY